MKSTGRFLTVIGLIAVCTPAFAAGSPSQSESPGCGTGRSVLAWSGFRGALSNALTVVENDPATGAGAGLRITSSPAGSADLAPPEHSPMGLPALRWPSLGGGAAPFYEPIPPTYLPCLLDAGTPSDQEDTLRLIRSHW